MSSSATATKYDVFLSFRGPDTRRNFISFLYKELVGRDIRTFKDEEELENGQRISPELKRAIEESRFAVVVVSVNYAASPWCLEELVKIMDLEKKRSITVMPIFYGVDPCHVRRQIGEVAEQFKKHEDREEDQEKVLSWKRALTDLASISGNCSRKWEDDSKLVDEIADKISKKLNIVTTRSNGRNLVGIYTHMKALNRLLDLNSNKSVRVVGIWAIGYNGRSALAKFVYQNICQHFESHCFLGSVKRISQGRHLSHLHEEFLERIQGEYSSKQSLKNQKVLLVADDVNELEQLDALADDFNCFGTGSVVIITTQDKLLLISSGIKLVYEVELLKFQKVYEVRQLFRSDAFKQRDDPVGFEQSTYRAMNISGSPSLTTWNYSMHPSLGSMANMIPPEHCGVRSYGCTDDPHPLAGSPSLTTWSFSMHRSLESMANMIPPEHCGVRSYGCTDDLHPLAGSPSLTTWSYSMHPSLESMANTISPDHCGVRSYGCIDDPHPSPKYTHSHDGVQWTIVSKSLLKTILLFGFISFGFYK